MILVVGATGQLGSMITERLLAQGQTVRAFVREASVYQALKKAGVEIVFGDLKKPDSLVPAFEGVAQVVTTATASIRGGKDTIEAVDLQGTRDLIDTAKAAGVEQFVYTSAFGFSPEAPLPLARAKGLNEVHLKESGLGYTILKPVNFMEVWIGFLLGTQLQQGPSVTIIGDGQVKHGFVAIENVADLAVAVLGHPAAKNTEVPLNGPSSVSYCEIISLIERTTGQSIEINSVAPGELVPGMPPIINELWALLAQMGDLDLDTSDVAQMYKLDLVTVEAFIQRTFGTGE